MAEDWLADVQKYAPDADPGIVSGLVRYCGIALQKRDSSLVSFSSPDELGRVRENFLKKKLGLTESDATLDGAIADVGDMMKGDRTKNRVTVYYLLARHFGQLGLFDKGRAKAAAPMADPPASTDEPVDLSSGVRAPASLGGELPSSTVSGATNDLGVAGSAALAGAAASMGSATSDLPTQRSSLATEAPLEGSAFEPPADRVDRPVDMVYEVERSGTNWWPWIIGALVLIALFFLLRGCADRPATTAQTETTTTTTQATTSEPAPAATAPAAVGVPVGAGVVAETRDSLPALNVFFDVGKSVVSADLASASTGLGDYVKAHPTTKVIVSGFNDPTGNAASNAALSKARAQAVAAALEKTGIPAGAIVLEKPANATSSGTGAESRRVEVTLRP